MMNYNIVLALSIEYTIINGYKLNVYRITCLVGIKYF